MVPETTAYSWWNCQISSASANCCQLIPHDCATVSPTLGLLTAAELTHPFLKPLRLPYSYRLQLSLLLAGDVHPNPILVTQYPCAVCTSNITSRGVSFRTQNSELRILFDIIHVQLIETNSFGSLLL